MKHEKASVYICSEDKTVRLGSAEVELVSDGEYGYDIILRDVDFDTECAKVATIETLRADIKYYANIARPEPTNAEKLESFVVNSYECGWTPAQVAAYLDHNGVTAPEETK